MGWFPVAFLKDRVGFKPKTLLLEGKLVATMTRVTISYKKDHDINTSIRKNSIGIGLAIFVTSFLYVSIT